MKFQHHFTCANCGYCCTLKVILTVKELKEIKSRGYTDFFEQENKSNHLIIKQQENGDCYFLERNGNKTSCQIYPVRPSPCKNYPPYSQNQLCKEFNPRVRAYLYRTRDKS